MKIIKTIEYDTLDNNIWDEIFIFENNKYTIHKIIDFEMNNFSINELSVKIDNLPWGYWNIKLSDLKFYTHKWHYNIKGNVKNLHKEIERRRLMLIENLNKEIEELKITLKNKEKEMDGLQAFNDKETL